MKERNTLRCHSMIMQIHGLELVSKVEKFLENSKAMINLTYLQILHFPVSEFRCEFEWLIA